MEEKKPFFIFEFLPKNQVTEHEEKLPKLDSFKGRRGGVRGLCFIFHTFSVRTHDF